MIFPQKQEQQRTEMNPKQPIPCYDGIMRITVISSFLPTTPSPLTFQEIPIGISEIRRLSHLPAITQFQVFETNDKKKARNYFKGTIR